jgi:hypothetical protein
MEDAGLEINMLKPQILARGVLMVDAYAAAKGFRPAGVHDKSIFTTVHNASA